MDRKFIDISIILDNDTVCEPPDLKPEIKYIDHHQSAAELCTFLPGLTKDKFPEGEAWAVETVSLCTHSGTHLDAPYHFHSTTNQGERSKRIDEIPLEWCFQPGVKLDFRHFPDGYVVTATDVKAELTRIQHTLKPLEIVLVNTRA